MRRTSLDWIEEATHLLRVTPASTLARYYIGAMPFSLALVWFWLDMSRNAFAGERLELASFAMAVLFVWMKCWQSSFAGGLLLLLNGQPEQRWTARRIARTAMQQAAIQPTAYAVLPASAITLLPFARAVGFYQNACLLGDGGERSMGELLHKARTLTSHWAREVWVMLAMQIGMAVFVFVNVASMLFTLPQLAKLFLGIESAFTTNAWAMLNSTFFLSCTLLTYLAVDPLLKACYVLRCFYGEAQTTAADLLAELHNQ